MQDLTVSIIQSSLYWQDIGANLAMFEEKIWTIKDTPDLIILPEMFNTGFTMEVESNSESMNFTTFKWMKLMAEQTKAVITGSYIVKDQGKYFNRLIWMTPSGEFKYYDKRHLFRMAGEHDFFQAGENKIITNIKGWNICPLICYDLRFPVWSRNIDNEFDLLIYVANWPTPRINAWDTLLKARAIENIAYTIGVNRVGEDGKGNAYNGHSSVLNHKGDLLFENVNDEVIASIKLNAEELQQFRFKFPAHLDADKFEIQ